MPAAPFSIQSAVYHVSRYKKQRPASVRTEPTRRAGIDCEAPYCIDDALLLRSVGLCELLLSNPQDLDRVTHVR